MYFWEEKKSVGTKKVDARNQKGSTKSDNFSAPQIGTQEDLEFVYPNTGLQIRNFWRNFS